MSDELRRDPLRIEEVLSGRRDPADVDPEALADARREEQRFQREVLPRTLDAVVAGRWHLRPASLAFASVLAAAAVVLVVAPWDRGTPTPQKNEEAASADSYIGVRGGPTLDLRVRRGDRVLRWAPGETLRAGDALRLIPYGRDYPWLLVFAVDGAGRAQVVVPFDGGTSQRLGSDGAPLPGSLILDEAPGREALVAVFSRAPLDAAAAAALAEGSLEQRAAAGSRSLRDGAVVVVGIPYEKETP